MATSKVSPYGRETFQAASANVPGQYKFAGLTTAGKIDKPSAGDIAVVLDDATPLSGPGTSAAFVAGRWYSCVFDGVVKVKLGASLNAGVQVTTDANGLAVAPTSGQFVNGVTMAAGSSGDEVPVRVSLSGAKAA